MARSTVREDDDEVLLAGLADVGLRSHIRVRSAQQASPIEPVPIWGLDLPVLVDGERGAVVLSLRKVRGAPAHEVRVDPEQTLGQGGVAPADHAEQVVVHEGSVAAVVVDPDADVSAVMVLHEPTDAEAHLVRELGARRSGSRRTIGIDFEHQLPRHPSVRGHPRHGMLRKVLAAVAVVVVPGGVEHVLVGAAVVHVADIVGVTGGTEVPVPRPTLIDNPPSTGRV